MENLELLSKVSIPDIVLNENGNPFIPDQTFSVEDIPYRQLILYLPAAFYTTDKNGYITFYNEAAVELWGRRPEIGNSPDAEKVEVFLKGNDKFAMIKVIDNGIGID